MTDWTEDTRVEITPAGRAHVEAARTPLRFPLMIDADYCGEWCATCDGTGIVPVGGAGNSESANSANCPDCTPDWQ